MRDGIKMLIKRGKKCRCWLFQAALEIGLNVGRVKMALKQRMEATGVPYANADELIEDVRHVQLAEEMEMYDRFRNKASSHFSF